MGKEHPVIEAMARGVRRSQLAEYGLEKNFDDTAPPTEREISDAKAAAKVLLEHAIGRSNTYQSDMTTPELWLRSYARELGIDLEDE